MMVDHSILNHPTYKFYKFCELMSMKQGSWKSFKQVKQHQKQKIEANKWQWQWTSQPQTLNPKNSQNLSQFFKRIWFKFGLMLVVEPN